MSGDLRQTKMGPKLRDSPTQIQHQHYITLAEGLKRIHEYNYVIGDVKPENMMLRMGNNDFK